MATNPILTSQINFMLRGGPLEMALQQLREKGIIQDEYVFRQYPEMIQITHADGKKGYVIVNSDEEKDRVEHGGMTSAQIEEEKVGLLARCRTMGIPADPDWSATRLKRLLGDELDAPAPGDNMAKLEAELAGLRKMAAMQAEIEALREKLAKPADDTETMRAQLADLGVKVDGRWTAGRLREELDRATNPEGA